MTACAEGCRGDRGGSLSTRGHVRSKAVAKYIPILGRFVQWHTVLDICPALPSLCFQYYLDAAFFLDGAKVEIMTWNRSKEKPQKSWKFPENRR
jgi:hypothetical protein